MSEIHEITSDRTGFPNPAADHADKPLSLDEKLILHPAATFFVRVAGIEMEEAGIRHGDLLVIDRSLRPRNGDCVIAYAEGNFIVRCYDTHRPGHPMLTNPGNLRPIPINEEVLIWGVVIHAITSFRCM